MKSLNVLYVLAAISFVLLVVSCQKSSTRTETIPMEPVLNTLTEDEKAAGWELLFDGSTLNGWKRYGGETIGPLWTVNNGAIMCDGSGHGEGSGEMGGSLMTTRDFDNFELSLEWKISPGGNSGVLYHVVEKPEYKYDYETGPEFQVMDDSSALAGGSSLRPEQLAGSNYDMFEASASKKLRPVGQWNTARIIYNNGHVEHWLNGVKVVEFNEASDDFKQRYENSKWVDYPGWNQYKSGAISLQDHGAPVYYRNIKIRKL